MTLAELTTILTGITGFSNKVAYRAFPENEAPALPFICYFVTGSDNTIADNRVFVPHQNVTIELYTRNKDVTSEELLESALNNASIPWEKFEDYISSEHCYQITYSITI